jgi:hypothetical protein
MGLPLIKEYQGALDRKKMSDSVRIGYEAYNSLKARSKKQGLPRPEFTARQFIGWWTKELETFTGSVPTCGRIDHSVGYCWSNIQMQDMRENSREGALRNGLNLKARLKDSKKLFCFDKSTGEIVCSFLSIRLAAKHFSTSQRLVQFVARDKYKKSKKIPFGLVEVA